jgi:hypothetical protein
MANTKISALSSGNPAQSGDLIPIDRSGANFSVTAASIAAQNGPFTGDYFLGPGQGIPLNGVNTAAAAINSLSSIAGANSIVVIRFTLNRAITITKVSWAAVTPSAASKVSFGLYNASLSKVLDSGLFDGSITTAQTNTITAVPLSPGVYYFAMTATDTTVTGITGVNVTTGPLWSGGVCYINSGSTKVGVATATATAGALPSSLTAITNNSPNPTNFWVPVFE